MLAMCNMLLDLVSTLENAIKTLSSLHTYHRQAAGENCKISELLIDNLPL